MVCGLDTKQWSGHSGGRKHEVWGFSSLIP